MSQSAMEHYLASSYPPVTNELLAEIVGRVLSVGSPLKILLFGSRARGDHKHDSDIDILILEESDENIRQKEVAYDRALRSIYPEKTVLARSLAEVEKWKYVRGYITTEALEQGKVLYEDATRLQYAAHAVEQAMRVSEEPEYKAAEDHARSWFEKGNADLRACQLLLENEGPYDVVCFHAQQAAEKYLKGFLALHQQSSQKTHNLELLVEECVKLLAMPDLAAIGLETMTKYAVDARYNRSFWPARQEAEDAHELALRVRRIVLAYVPPDSTPT